MATFTPGTWVWVEDEVERFIPGIVQSKFSAGQPGFVTTQDGEEIKLNPSQTSKLIECNPEALQSSFDDLVNISDLNEMSILHLLRIRFKEDKIYTNISSILISVNPFKLMPLYTPEVLDMYRNGYRGKPPHVFGIAYNAYSNMLSENQDQSVVISGESGAGKSEATKLILQFVTDVSSRTSHSGDENGSHSNSTTTSGLEQQILAANPILEAFGNAKTLRNNNSSRFGKLITINFGANGSIVGGGIINYLLEKSRVVTQTPGERNYHIFYQLLSLTHTNPRLAEEFKLQSPNEYELINQSGVFQIPGVSDEKEFEDVLNSMKILHFSPNEKNEVIKIVSGVLHFGNILFHAHGDTCAISNPDVLVHAANMWGINPEQIQKFLCAKNIGAKTETILVGYTVKQGQDCRDAMVKRVYADLFQLLINRINFALSSGGTQNKNRFIGVLDIFGFESFEVNSFEQLCINFCNEKLQFHFNEHIFKMEQSLYQAEGISIPGSSFVDNQATLDLLEARSVGLFGMIDEELNVPKGSEEGLLSKMIAKYNASASKHPNFIKPGPKDCKEANRNFGVLHYAGAVYYNVTNFLEKNRDQLHGDILNVLKCSSSEFFRSIFPPEEEGAGGAKANTKGKAAATKTLGGQFKSQLNDLISTLNLTHPHFIRCMKSNDKKVGNIFDSLRMQDQLRCAGLVEVCRIRKSGYPVRRTFEEFFYRYKCIALSCADVHQLIDNLSASEILKSGDWAKGTTRVFLRNQQSIELELLREESLIFVALIVQKYARGFFSRLKLKKFLRILKSLKAAIESRQEGKLAEVLLETTQLPWAGAHHEYVKQAKELIKRIKEESRILSLLTNALSSNELNTLKSALSSHAAMSPPFNTPLSQQVSDLIHKLEYELEIKNGLKRAIAARDLNLLNDFILQACEIELMCTELHQAIALKERIDKEEELLSRIQMALSSPPSEGDLITLLNSLISEAAEMGLDSQRAEIQNAQRKKQQLLAEQMAAAEAAARAAEEEKQRLAMEQALAKRAQAILEAKQNLDLAIQSNNPETIHAALQNALQVGLEDKSAEVISAHQILNKLMALKDLRSKLMVALDVLQGVHNPGASDLEPLFKAIKEIQKAGYTSHDIEELESAKETFQFYKKQVEINMGLQEAMKTNDRAVLREALNLAENLDLDLEVMSLAREKLKELEIAFRKEKSGLGVSGKEFVEAYDEAEAARQKQREIASQGRFEIKNFPNLRSPDDFSRGFIFTSSKAKADFLQFQTSVIPKSLVDFQSTTTSSVGGGKGPADLVNMSIQIHKCLLGYMGDKAMPFPAMLAQDILRKGFEIKDLRDEIYLQIIKQLTNNPRPESIAKGWQIMSMCVATFPPSFEFENYLLHFLLEKKANGRGGVIEYAKYSLRTLEAIITNSEGTGGFIPSVDEILSYKDRPPVLVSIHLVDDNVITSDLPITPDMNVGKVIEMCVGWLDLKDPRINHLGIFVYDLGETAESLEAGDNPFANNRYADLIRTPRPLKNDEYLGDVVVQEARQRRNYKLVLKQKIFLSSHFDRGEDPLFERLLYLQAEDDCILGDSIVLEQEEDISLCGAISMVVAYGEELGQTVQQLIDQDVVDFISPANRHLRSPEEWSRIMLTYREGLVGLDDDDLQEQLLHIARQSPHYGMHWFYVYKIDTPPEQKLLQQIPPEIENLPTNLLLGFNAEGLKIYDHGKKKQFASFPYADILRWGGSSSQFNIVIASDDSEESEGEFELLTCTSQGLDMGSIILDHIKAIMS